MEVAYNSRYEFEAKESVTRRRHGLNGRAARAEGQRSFESRRLAALNKELYSHIYSCRKTLRRLLTFVQRTVCALSLSLPSLALRLVPNPPFFIPFSLLPATLPSPLPKTRRCIFTSSLSFLPSFQLSLPRQTLLSLSLSFVFDPRFIQSRCSPTPVRHFGTNLLLPSLEDCFSIFDSILIEFQAAVWNYITLDVIKKNFFCFPAEAAPFSLSLCSPVSRQEEWTTIFWR